MCLYYRGIFIIFLLLFLSCRGLFSRNINDTIKFTPQQMHEDADYFFQTIQRIHPDIYHYCGLIEFERKKKEIYDKLNFQLTAEEFYQILSTINFCLDDHTGISMATGINFIVNSNKKLFNEILSNNRENFLFPKIFFSENKICTLINNKKEEILSINGIDINDINSFIKPRLVNWAKRKSQILIENFFPFWLYRVCNINSPFLVEHKNEKKYYKVFR